MTYPTVRTYIDLTSGAFTNATSWTEITAWTKPVRCQHGRSTVRDDFQPGSGSMRLVNNDGRFDPLNTAGPYYPNLQPRRRVKVEATVGATTYPLAHGWVRGWPTAQEFRTVDEPTIEWVDALAVLARTELPDSVYDHVVGGLSPTAWYKLQDRLTPTLEDSSGNGNHGLWGTIEETQSFWSGLEARPLPATVLKAGEADSVIPGAGRPGMSWSRLQAEIAQPLNGATDTPRAPVARAGDATLVETTDPWSIEAWFIYRQAFMVGETNTYTATPVTAQQVLWQWGENPAVPGPNAFHVWKLELQIYLPDSSSYPSVVVQNHTNTSAASVQPAGQYSLDDGKPHQVIVTWDTVTLRLYVDGAFVDSDVVTIPPNSMPATPLGIGVAYNYGGSSNNLHRMLQSITGDFVFYGYQLLAADIEDLWYAGRYGSLTTATRLTSGQVIDQALGMIGWGQPVSVAAGNHYVKPEVTARAGALDYIRAAARSENGPFWQAPDGTLTFLPSDWPATHARAATVQWQLSDNGSTALSFAWPVEVDYDDDALVNDVTADWVDGTQRAENAASVTSYGRSRDSIATILDTPDDALQLANWHVAAHADPYQRLRRGVTIRPSTTTDFEFVCGVRVLDRVAMTRTTTDGRTVTEEYWVQGISHDIDPGQGRWETRLQLDLADIPGRLFTLDTSTLDGVDVLAY